MQTTERGEKMRQPEEIKMGLEFDIGCCSNCYKCSSVDNPYGCKDRANQIAVAEDALEYIRQLEAKVPKWISVTTELPKSTDKKYEVWLSYAHAADVAEYCGDGEWMYPDHCNITRFVTHWKEMTEGPEEG